jgi:hypothetical protein
MKLFQEQRMYGFFGKGFTIYCENNAKQPWRKLQTSNSKSPIAKAIE